MVFPAGRRSAPWLAWLLLACLGVPAHGQTVWEVEVVDSRPGGNIGKHAALAIDTQGNFHLAYYDEGQKALRYAFRFRDDKRWYTMDVAKDVGTYVSLVVDRQDRPHLAYGSPYETGLHYAFWDGKQWRKKLIDRERVNYFTSLALDAEGRPRISYYRYHNPDGSYALQLKYAYFDGRTWFIETVDRREGTGKFNSLAVDAAGRPHIAYSDVPAGDLKYAHWDGERWQFGTADARKSHGHYVGLANSIWLDASGNPHIAYFDGTGRVLKYAWRAQGRWQTEVADRVRALSNHADRVSLKLDSQGRPHIAYYDSGLGALKYAVRVEKGWRVEVADQEGNVGLLPSLCLNERDEPYVAYHDLTNGALRVAHRKGGNVVAATEARDARP